MNLETFKARARRKLELPHGRRPDEQPANPTPPSAEPVAAAPAQQQDTMSSQDQPAMTQASSDRFASALAHARREQLGGTTTGKPEPINPPTQGGKPVSLHSLTGSPAQVPESAPTELPRPAATTASRTTASRTDNSDDADFQHLRSLLLGSSYESQQDQVDVVYQRTQAGINALRRDMDARLTDLGDYVEQLEQSILNSLDMQREAQSGAEGGLGEDAAERLAQTDARLDARLERMDGRLSDLLDKLRSDIDEHRQEDRAFLQQELNAVNSRTDLLLSALNERFEKSLGDTQSALSDQLQQRGAMLLGESDAGGESAATVDSLRERLGELIDERIAAFNSEQSRGLVALREQLATNPNAIKAELRSQTDEQRSTLAQHRSELENQFNAAITTLNSSKVSHKELSQLLSRLADRVQAL